MRRIDVDEIRAADLLPQSIMARRSTDCSWVHLGPCRTWLDFATLGETKPDSGIEQVLVRKGRLSSSVRKGALISVEADSTLASQAVYEPIETIDQRLPLYAYNAFTVKR